MVMIARNERANVRACFASFWDHVDEVVLCDTGSRDGTIGEARAFARERGEPGKLIVGRFKWREDFAAARTYAHSLATGELHAVIDLDERVVGAQHLRTEATRLAEQPELDVILARWSGPITPESWRPILLRPPVTWSGRTWERPSTGTTGRQAAALDVRLEHTRERPRGRRDLDIALGWADADPDDYWAWRASAFEAFDNAEWTLAANCCERGLSCPVLPELIAAQLYLVWSRALYQQRHYERAEDLAAEAIAAGEPHLRTLHDLRRGTNQDRQVDANGDLFAAWQLRGECALKRDAVAALRCAMTSVGYAATEEQLRLAAKNARAALDAVAVEARELGMRYGYGSYEATLRGARKVVAEHVALLRDCGVAPAMFNPIATPSVGARHATRSRRRARTHRKR